MTFTFKNKFPLLSTLFLGLFAAISVGCGGGGGGTPPPPAAPTTFTIGGSITGLSNSGLSLQNNNGDDLTISATDSRFTFATALNTNENYAVSIATQPVGQTCTVSSGSGTVASSNITDVVINCVLGKTVGGRVTGLSNTGLVLQNNGGDDLNISAANDSFTFASVLTANTSYAVSIASPPVGQTCTLSNNTGTMANSDITDVVINCTLNNNDASGLYTGSTGETSVGFANVNNGNDYNLDFIRGIVYDNRFLFFNVDPKANTETNQNENVLIDGQISGITGTTVTATASIYQAGRIVANNISVTGTVTSRNNISLIFSAATAVTGAPAGNFNGGTLNATFSTEFDRGALDARIDSPVGRNWGFWTMRDVYMYFPAAWSNGLMFREANDTYRFVIDNALTPSQTCGSDGSSTTIPDVSINVYQVSVTMFGLILCDELDNSTLFTGLAAVVDVNTPADTIWYASANGTYSIYAVLNR